MVSFLITQCQIEIRMFIRKSLEFQQPIQPTLQVQTMTTKEKNNKCKKKQTQMAKLKGHPSIREAAECLWTIHRTKSSMK